MLFLPNRPRTRDQPKVADSIQHHEPVAAAPELISMLEKHLLSGSINLIYKQYKDNQIP